MTVILLGLATALLWGVADFIARFTGQALGYRSATLGMLGASVLVLSALYAGLAQPWVGGLAGVWLIGLTGVGLLVATLLLYAGLTRGPVSVVAPIAGSYPAFSLLFALLSGVRPALTQWLAMALTMTGVAVVAAGAAKDRGGYAGSLSLRYGVVMALLAAFGFAVTIAAGQAAAAVYGELQTVLLARYVALACIMVLFCWRRERPRLALGWLPLLALQGLLDGGAYLALLAAGQGEGAVIAVVIASAFSAVTVLLARQVLGETMSARQWLGVAMILVGVAVLSAYAQPH